MLVFMLIEVFVLCALHCVKTLLAYGNNNVKFSFFFNFILLCQNSQHLIIRITKRKNFGRLEYVKYRHNMVCMVAAIYSPSA